MSPVSAKARAKALYDRRRALRLCVRCGSPVTFGMRCEAHRASENAKWRAFYGRLSAAHKIVSKKKSVQVRKRA